MCHGQPMRRRLYQTDDQRLPCMQSVNEALAGPSGHFYGKGISGLSDHPTVLRQRENRLGPSHGEASPWFMLAAVAYGLALALLAGYLSGWIAGRRPVLHGALVAAILALGATASLVASIGKGAIWSQASVPSHGPGYSGSLAFYQGPVCRFPTEGPASHVTKGFSRP